METDQITNLLTITLVFFCILLFILIMVYCFLVLKKRKVQKKENAEEKESVIDVSKTKSESEKKSVKDFMNFYNIQDDMIIQKKAKKFLMVIQCQGVNYDLMSAVEKNSVEAGFVQFLNTLNHPIQLYIQTRKVNLTSSINTYKKKLNICEEKYNKLKYQYERMKKDSSTDNRDLNKLFFELTKQKNLYEYTKDIIKNTEMMSLNKNILSKQYYIVISYMPESDETALMNNEEILDYAFSELYTRAQSLIRVLNVCEVNSKVLNSLELAELLYVAYNREDSDVFSAEDAARAGYDSLYVTAPDVLDKKKKNLDKMIEQKAWEKANKAVENAIAKSNKQKALEEEERNLDALIKQMAKVIVEQNSKGLTSDVTKYAVEEIENSDGEEGDN